MAARAQFGWSMVAVPRPECERGSVQVAIRSNPAGRDIAVDIASRVHENDMSPLTNEIRQCRACKRPFSVASSASSFFVNPCRDRRCSGPLIVVASHIDRRSQSKRSDSAIARAFASNSSRFGTNCGLKSRITTSPKSATSGLITAAGLNAAISCLLRPYLAYTGGVSDHPACSLHLVGKERYFR